MKKMHIQTLAASKLTIRRLEEIIHLETSLTFEMQIDLTAAVLNMFVICRKHSTDISH